MKRSLLPLSVLLTLMALMTSCAPTSFGSATVNRVLDVTGRGIVRLEPDIVSINIGVQSRSTDAGGALEENTQKIQAIIESLIEMGVERNDIQTQNFNIYQQQDLRFPEEETETTPTYVIENTVAIIVREIDALGGILTNVIDQGANAINSIRFDVEDRETPAADARKLAIEDAKSQAASIAETAGVQLVEIQSIDVQTSSTILPRAAFAMEDALGGGEVPISGGTMTIEVSVNMTYSIK